MQVILREDIEKVGLRGEVVDVAPGFARNYLLPRRLAEPAAPGRVAELEKLASSRARHEAQSFEQAQELVQKLEGAEIRFDVNAGDTGTLFGSVTATDIADRIWETQRIRIDRRKLDLPESIKRIGRYEVPVELFQDVTATLRLLIVPEGGELPPEEELDALDQAAAQQEAAAEAEAEQARVAEAAATETAVAEAEAEEQVPEADEAAADGATEGEAEATPEAEAEAQPE
ncbi:MAG TPA: 50S ribosomal protein L9 [Gaiellaceae bacterium]|nr:50S ribosomal protein L9 [Gaiellaceae bacterium]